MRALITFTLSATIMFSTLSQEHRSHMQNHQVMGTIEKSSTNLVCLVLYTKIDDLKWSDKWRNDFLWYTRNVLIKSIRRQCSYKYPCPSLANFNLYIKTNNKTFEQLANPGNWIHFEQSHPTADEQISETVAQSDCGWVAFTWIDADDAFMDGYFNYISAEIPKVLLGSKTHDGYAWRGAVFAAREMQRLLIGHNRCETDFFGHMAFYSGQSQGQGIILRTDVWRALGSMYIHRGKHTAFLKVAREKVMHGLGYTDYFSQTCHNPYFYWKNVSRQISYEEADASESRILFIDVTSDWKSSAIFIQTPFSSHFPFHDYLDLPFCDMEQQAAICKEYPKDIGYLLPLAKRLNFTFEDACQNNRFLGNVNLDCKKLLKDST